MTEILRRERWIVFIILAFGVVIRLIRIDQPLLEFFPQRQTQTAEITRNIYVNGWTDFWTPTVRYLTGSPIPFVVEFPLYNGIVSMLYQIFGLHLVLGRLTSLFFFVFSALLFYKLLRTNVHHASRIANSELLFSFLFFVFSPLHILTSRSFQPEEMALFLLLLAIQKSSWIAFSLAVLIKLPVLLFAPVLLYQLHARGVPLRRAIIGFSTSLVAPIAWFLRAKTLAVHPELVRNSLIHNWFQPQLLFTWEWYASLFQIEHIWVLTTLGLLCVWIGLWRWSKLPRLWIIWLVSGMFYFGIFNFHAMTHEYYHLLLLPPLGVIVGTGITQIARLLPKTPALLRMIAHGGLLALLIGGLSFSAINKILTAPFNPTESQEVPVSRYLMITDPKRLPGDSFSSQTPSPSTFPTAED